MSFFKPGKNNDAPKPLTKEQYAKINRFLDKVGESGPKWYQNLGPGPRPEVDALDKILAWADRTHAERNHLSEQLFSARQKIERLEADLAATQRRVHQLEDESRQAEAQHLMKVRHFEDERRRVDAQHTGEIDSLRLTHSSIIQREQDMHGKEVRKLVGELLVNQGENTGWTDEKLKTRYRELQTSISSLVSPRSNTLRQLSFDQQIGRDLDPTGFLSRTTHSKAHFLLQNRIWNILYDRFFSLPFGFGVLGRGDAQEQLFDMFLSWTKLLGKSLNETPSPSSQVYTLFAQGQLVNDWRTTTFQCINESLSNASDGTPTPAESIAALAVHNAKQACEDIKSMLARYTDVSARPALASLDELVSKISVDSQQMAMQFGLHAARLQLLVPAPGDEVRIGSEIQDCEDGDCDRGSTYVVDLVTLPGLQVVGDGRSDRDRKRTLVPCEIYPHQF